LQKVIGDRIFENGKEVIWRACGGSYLFHEPDRYLEAWQLHLPEIKAMGLNAMRLEFIFADSQVPSPPEGEVQDVLDFEKMDAILDFLSANGIKGILSLLNWKTMYGDFGTQKVRDDWRRVAQHYAGDERVAAYELFNEPGSSTWDPSIVDKMGVAREYAALTDVVRVEDPDHIAIWTVKSYLPYTMPLSNQLKGVFDLYGRPNIVCSGHWWPHKEYDFRGWGPETLCYKDLEWHVKARELLGIPQWVGEVGALTSPFDHTNPEYAYTERMLWLCEQQAIGWELHMGPCYLTKPWNHYLVDPIFPLKVYNSKLVRQPWKPPMPDLRKHISAVSGAASDDKWYLVLKGNGDSVTLTPGIIVKVFAFKKDTTKPWPFIGEVIRDEVVEVKTLTTITNYENTSEFPGDYDTEIYSIGSPSTLIVPLFLLAALYFLSNYGKL